MVNLPLNTAVVKCYYLDIECAGKAGLTWNSCEMPNVLHDTTALYCVTDLLFVTVDSEVWLLNNALWVMPFYQINILKILNCLSGVYFPPRWKQFFKEINNTLHYHGNLGHMVNQLLLHDDQVFCVYSMTIISHWPFIAILRNYVETFLDQKGTFKEQRCQWHICCGTVTLLLNIYCCFHLMDLFYFPEGWCSVFNNKLGVWGYNLILKLVYCVDVWVFILM